MAKAEMLVKELKKKTKDDKVQPITIARAADGSHEVKRRSKKCNCCCDAHCRLAFHSRVGQVIGVHLANLDKDDDLDVLEFPYMFEKDLFSVELDESSYDDVDDALESKDPIRKMLVAMETNFGLN